MADEIELQYPSLFNALVDCDFSIWMLAKLSDHVRLLELHTKYTDTLGGLPSFFFTSHTLPVHHSRQIFTIDLEA